VNHTINANGEVATIPHGQDASSIALDHNQRQVIGAVNIYKFLGKGAEVGAVSCHKDAV